MTALSFGGAPGVAVLGGDLTQLRRRGGGWRWRDWRLRTKLTAVLLVPLLLAGVLGVLRVADSLRVADNLDAAARQLGFAQQVGLAVHDLQRERLLATELLVTLNPAVSTELQEQTRQVDSRIDALRAGGSELSELESAAAGPYQAVLDRLGELSALRDRALTAGIGVEEAVAAYSDLVTELLDLNGTVLIDNQEPVARHNHGVEALTIAEEQISQQHALLLAGILSGGLPGEQQALLRITEARFEAAIEAFQDAEPAEQQRYETVTNKASTDRKRLLDLALDQALQDELLEISAAEWNIAAAANTEQIREVQTSLLEMQRAEATRQSAATGDAAVRDAAVVVALLLLAVLLLVLVVRSLLGPLRTLRTAAFEVADRRLPEVVEKLRNPDQEIGETVVDPVPVFSREEVGQVARAFDTVHVQAVRLAAEQAMLRSTINDIFLNLAGRSQRLVERQLNLIDKLESAEQDPEQLSNLFQLDHLATRMRRNSENLLVLAGGELRRGTERGIAVLDLLRAAVSEIAEYRRVTLRRPPAATVTGPVAGDLVHLIAELLDNATSAGPPDTPVTLSSAFTEDGGLLVEITDCGTGLPPGELHAINERLAAPPVVDVSVSRQMGLFVVSRLAARHHIRVRLRQQRGEFGITAMVQLPPSLVSPATTPSGYSDPDEATAAQWRETDPAYPAPEEATTTQWRGTDGDLPLQVSVVEEAAEPDQLGPSSIGTLGLPRRNPRTTEQEWLELFGRDEPGHAPLGHPEPAASAQEEVVSGEIVSEEVISADMVPGAVSPGEVILGEVIPDQAVPGEAAPVVPADAAPVIPVDTAPVDAAPVVLEVEQPAPPIPLGMPKPADTQSPEVHEGIFEEVSAWFQEWSTVPIGRPVRNGDAEETATSPNGVPNPPPTALPAVPAPASEWHSVADAGWHAASALHTPVDYGVTAAGLPKRRPRAHLVPGAADTGSLAAPPSAVPAPARTPDDVRGRLSSYQRGLEHGRHARLGPDEVPARAYTSRRGTEEVQQ